MSFNQRRKPCVPMRSNGLYVLISSYFVWVPIGRIGSPLGIPDNKNVIAYYGEGVCPCIWEGGQVLSFHQKYDVLRKLRISLIVSQEVSSSCCLICTLVVCG